MNQFIEMLRETGYVMSEIDISEYDSAQEAIDDLMMGALGSLEYSIVDGTSVVLNGVVFNFEKNGRLINHEVIES